MTSFFVLTSPVNMPFVYSCSCSTYEHALEESSLALISRSRCFSNRNRCRLVSRRLMNMFTSKLLLTTFLMSRRSSIRSTALPNANFIFICRADFLQHSQSQNPLQLNFTNCSRLRRRETTTLMSFELSVSDLSLLP